MDFILGMLLIIAAAVIAYNTRALDFTGSVSGIVLAEIILFSQNFKWVLIFFMFFLIGTLATEYGKKKKHEVRTLKNVVSNGLASVIMAFLGNVYAFVGSLSTAVGDTVSSEIGVLSKEKPRLIINFKKVKPGTDGGVTVLGTAAGLVASFVLSLTAYFILFPNPNTIIVGTLSGFFGNIVDSIIGALFERKGLCTNAGTNFIATLYGGVIAFWLGQIL
jgi:uncharacterized protein (TIGR00297 family)